MSFQRDSSTRGGRRVSALALLFLLFSTIGQAQPPQSSSAVTENSERVSYEAGFFREYNVITALDMVEQVPGFQIDQGGELRGFGGTAGNILINSERPSTKNDDAAAILGRIPATAVVRIDLIRGETAGLNLRGQAVVVDVILRGDDAASTRWQADIRTTENTSTVNPQTELSHTGRRGLTRFTAGISAGEPRSHQPRGPELLLIGGQVAEERDEVENESGENLSANINTSTQFSSGALLNFNARLGNDKFESREESRRLALSTGLTSRNVFEGNVEDKDSIEVGADFTLPVSGSFGAKFITLFNRADIAGTTSVRTENFQQALLSSSIAHRDTDDQESIARVELDWSRDNGHRLEINLENAVNTLDNSLQLFRNEGMGFVEISLPGANTEVEEDRWDLEFNYSLNVGRIAVDGGISFEDSTIEQRGDANKRRSFTYTKPRLMLTHSSGNSRQTRIRIQREVAQLNFNEFVTATNFGDNQVDFGNPDLKPETIWVTEFTLEQRFGELRAINLTAYHHWIDDVQDLLPLGGIFEIPGNIGKGRRWGVRTELTLPLDNLGMKDTRIDLTGFLQDSKVTDPVTGASRVLSSEPEYFASVDFRKTWNGGVLALGGMVAVHAEVPRFGLDEYVVSKGIADTVDMDVYVETTRWFGLRMRLQFGNVLNRTFHRERLVYSGARGLSPLAFGELRERTRGHSTQISITGVF